MSKYTVLPPVDQRAMPRAAFGEMRICDEAAVWDEATQMAPPSNLEITAAKDVPGMDILLVIIVHNKMRRKSESSATPNLGLHIPSIMRAGNGPFTVDGIVNESPCGGSMQVGDQLVAVGRQCPSNNVHLARLLSKANSESCCTITVRRPGIMNSQSELRRRLVQDAGCSPDTNIFIAYMEYSKGGPALGLLIKHRQYKVIVSRVEPDTLTAMTLQRGDRIMDVNGQPMSDKEVAKTTILESMKRRAPFTLLVERPVSDRAKKEIDELLAQASKVFSNNGESRGDLLLPGDAQSIAKCEQMRRRHGLVAAPRRPILQQRVQTSMMGQPPAVRRSEASNHSQSDEGGPFDEPYQMPIMGGRHTPVSRLTQRLRRRDSAKRSVSFTKKPTEHKIATITDPTLRLKHLGKRYS